jgi:hypothetical protein
MIRFKTIDAEAGTTPSATFSTPAEPPVAVPDAPKIAVELPVRSKGLTRKTPLQAKRPAAAGLSRDEIG